MARSGAGAGLEKGGGGPWIAQGGPVRDDVGSTERAWRTTAHLLRVQVVDVQPLGVIEPRLAHHPLHPPVFRQHHIAHSLPVGGLRALHPPPVCRAEAAPGMTHVPLTHKGSRVATQPQHMPKGGGADPAATGRRTDRPLSAPACPLGCRRYSRR